MTALHACAVWQPSPICREIFTLPFHLQEYGGKIPPSDQVYIDDMKEVVNTFNRAMTDAGTYVEDRKPSMITVLEENVKAMFVKLTVSNTWHGLNWHRA